MWTFLPPPPKLLLSMPSFMTHLILCLKGFVLVEALFLGTLADSGLLHEKQLCFYFHLWQSNFNDLEDSSNIREGCFPTSCSAGSLNFMIFFFFPTVFILLSLLQFLLSSLIFCPVEHCVIIIEKIKHSKCRSVDIVLKRKLSKAYETCRSPGLIFSACALCNCNIFFLPTENY